MIPTFRFLVPVLLALTVALSSAQTDFRREAAIDVLIRVQVQKTGVILDERALEALVGRFRRTNTGVPEDVWRSVKADVKALILRVLAEKDGPFDKASRQAMLQFSTVDIEKLVAIHTDPLFIRYTDSTLAAMATPAGEFALRMAIEKSVAEMNELVVKHGLKPAY
jgi:hypothetical protein